MLYTIFYVISLLVVAVLTFPRIDRYFFVYVPLSLMFLCGTAKAETYYTFHYKTPDQLKISVPGKDYFEARTKAGKHCFKLLTGGVYPGEELGLQIIDICSNPLNKN